MYKIITINRVSKSINSKEVLKDIHLDIYNEGISVITGHNGAGKSTLLKVIAKILSPTTGDISYNDNKDYLTSSFVFQKPVFLNRSVRDNLLYAIKNSKKGLNYKQSLITKQLKELGLSYLYHSPAKNLSLGEQQLVAFMRSIIVEPLILFLDEPTSSLDEKNKTLVNNLLLKLSKNIKIIMTSQSTDQIQLLTNKPIIMQNGMLI